MRRITHGYDVRPSRKIAIGNYEAWWFPDNMSRVLGIGAEHRQERKEQ